MALRLPGKLLWCNVSAHRRWNIAREMAIFGFTGSEAIEQLQAGFIIGVITAHRGTFDFDLGSGLDELCNWPSSLASSRHSPPRTKLHLISSLFFSSMKFQVVSRVKITRTRLRESSCPGTLREAKLQVATPARYIERDIRGDLLEMKSPKHPRLKGMVTVRPVKSTTKIVFPIIHALW
jgi:hypothetical protein